eukprot:GILJ01004454.1.p1 GENE.GILJ01004454.1~~GILJ01004454.1.p1  ORF type:complete len:476 (-),score=67.04 GILJ01004454.1:192-1619(-)
MCEYFRKYIKKEHQPQNPIRFRCSFQNTIYDTLKRRGWKEVDSELDWDIFWADKEWIHDVMDYIHLQPHQRVNHFRNHYELTRKDLLIKNLKRTKRALEKEGRVEEASKFNFFPTTFNLPAEYSLFVEEFKRNHGSVWIMKPIGRAQGKGIFLFSKLSQISDWKNDGRWKTENTTEPREERQQAEPYIVQRYVNNPLLIGGKKFDLRIYALVTSYSPLTIYLYRTGFARFTTTRFSMKADDIVNTYVHLTNVAVQKTADNYNERTGGKWDLRNLKLYLLSKYSPPMVNELFSDIQELIIRSLMSVQKVMINDKHCFELYGYDVLMDSNLKPWLLEVNASPSLTANTPSDYEMKIAMLDDVLTILDLEHYMTGAEEQVGGFDLIYRNGHVRPAGNSLYNTFLGCYNNRAPVLKKLAKQAAARLAAQPSGLPEAPQPGNPGKPVKSDSFSSSSAGSRRATASSKEPSSGDDRASSAV